MKNLVFVSIYAGFSQYITRTEKGYMSKTVDPVNGMIKDALTKEEAFDIVTDCLADAENLECSAQFESNEFACAYYAHITPAPEEEEAEQVTQANYVYTVDGILFMAKEDMFSNGQSFVSYFKQDVGNDLWELITADEWFDLRTRNNAVYCGKTQA